MPGQNLIPYSLRNISPIAIPPLRSFFSNAASFEDNIFSSNMPAMIQWEFVALESALWAWESVIDLVKTWN